MILNKLNLELQGKIALTYETVKSLDNWCLNHEECQATLYTSLLLEVKIN